MTTRTRLLSAARPRHWVLTAAELHALGMTRSAVRAAERAGLLHRIHNGIYAVGRPDLSPEGRWRAATLAMREGTLSHRSGAQSWVLVPVRGGSVDVTVPCQTGYALREGIVLHRCDRLRPEDVTYRNGIRVTTLRRTLRDLAGVLDADGLVRAVRQADRLHGLDLAALHDYAGPPRPGATRENRLRKALERYVPADVGEGLEDAAFQLIVDHGLPVPETQHPIGRYWADFAWPAERLVVETDDRASHDTWTQRQEDRVRDREMAALGWEVMRFTWAEITRQPAQVAREIRAALDRRRVVAA